MTGDDAVPPRSKSMQLSEGVLLAVAPVLAYVLAFTFELGYMDYFKAPSDMIRINIVVVLTTGAALLGLIVLLFVVLDMFATILLTTIGRPLPAPLSRSFRVTFPPLLLLLLQLFLFGPSRWQYWIPTFVGLAIAVYIEFLLPLSTQRRTKGYLAKLEAQAVTDRNMPGLVPLLPGEWATKRRALFGFVVLLPSLLIVYTLGAGRAVRTEFFYVTNTEPEMVVIRIYEDTILCAPFDRESRNIEPRFTVMKLGEDQGLILSREKLGSLTVE